MDTILLGFDFLVKFWYHVRILSSTLNCLTVGFHGQYFHSGGLTMTRKTTAMKCRGCKKIRPDVRDGVLTIGDDSLGRDGRKEKFSHLCKKCRTRWKNRIIDEVNRVISLRNAMNDYG